MRMLRIVLAAIVGYVVFAALAVALFAVTGQASHAAASTGTVVRDALLGMLFAAFGGFVAATIARNAPRRAAAIMSGILLLGATVSIIASPGTPHWSQYSAIALMAPSAYVGGWWRARRTAR